MIFGMLGRLRTYKLAAYSLELALIVCGAFLLRTFGYGLYRVPTGSMETTMLVGELFFADKWCYHMSPIKRGDIVAFNDPLYPYAAPSLKRWFQRYVWGPENWTKRVIAVPGDTVQGVVCNGRPRVYCNGVALKEPYVNSLPLIGVWKQNPDTIIPAALTMDSAQLHASWSFKTCDLSKSFDEQLYYMINSHYIMRDADGTMIIRLAHVPNISRGTHEGRTESYWDGSDEFCVTLADGEYWVMGDNRRDSFDSRAFGPLKRELIHGKIRFRVASFDSDATWLIADFFLNPKQFIQRIRWSRWCEPVA